MSKQKIIIYEIFGFLSILIFVWLNEIIDIPHTIFKMAKTPVNIAESIIESSVVITVAIITISITTSLLKKIRHLESFLQICCECKKIHDNKKNEWVRMEVYFDEHSKIKFSHGFCPECVEEFVKDQ